MRTVTTFQELHSCLNGQPSSLTIGVFDGVHAGHQALVRETLRLARKNGALPVAVTFRNHPLSVLAPPYNPKNLITPERKAALLHDLGIELVALLEFTPEFAATSADDFITRNLVEMCNVKALVCGYDFTFGQRGAGNTDVLKAGGAEHGFQVTCLQPVNHDEKIVKSTHIRDLLTSGKVAKATIFLTRPHEVPGIVVPGMQRGRTIGFPTANLQIIPNYQLPARGVYVCAARIENETELRPAMVNIGTSPTFGENAQTVEAYILSFDGDIKGKTLSLYFLEKIRDERRFPAVAALIDQLKADQTFTETSWDFHSHKNTLSAIPRPIDHHLKK